MSPVDWSQLSAADEATLLSSPAIMFVAGVELLNPDLTVAQDLSDYLETENADIEWQAGDGNSVHRDCSITLTTELSWGTALLRIYRVHTDLISGISARCNRGVFCPQTPAVVLDTIVRDATGTDAYEWPVTGQDRTSLLDTEPGFTVFYPPGTRYTDAMASAATSAGVPAGTYLVDGSRTDTIPDPGLVWALVPSTSGSDSSGPDSGLIPTDPDLATTDTAGNGDTVTWRQIINELSAPIAYRNVYADDNGYLRSEPYIAPAARAPRRFAIEVADEYAPVSPGRALTHDLWRSANKWTAIWTNMPDDESGNAQIATPDNGGIVTVTNDANGPASYTGRGNRWVPRTLQLTAATPDDVIVQAEAIAAFDQRDVSTMTVNLSPFPAGHFDVLSWIDSLVAQRGLSPRVQLQSWVEPLDSGDMQLTVQFV